MNKKLLSIIASLLFVVVVPLVSAGVATDATGASYSGFTQTSDIAYGMEYVPKYDLTNVSVCFNTLAQGTTASIMNNSGHYIQNTSLNASNCAAFTMNLTQNTRYCFVIGTPGSNPQGANQGTGTGLPVVGTHGNFTGQCFGSYSTPSKEFYTNSYKNVINVTSTNFTAPVINTLTLSANNSVNLSGITGLCVYATGTNTTQDVCNSTGTTVSFNTTGTYNITLYSLGLGNGSQGIYFNATRQNYVFNTTQELNLNASVAYLNVTATQKYTGASISGFNITNGMAVNTSAGTSVLIPANSGTNTLRFDHAGNFSTNTTCTATSLQIGSCQFTNITDANVTFFAANSTSNLTNYTLTLNSSLGTESYTVSGNNVTVGLLRGYQYTATAVKGSYVQNSTTFTLSTAYQNVTIGLQPITLTITFLDERTRTNITTNVSLSVIDSTGTRTAYSTNTSSVTLAGTLPPGSYTFRYSATNYSTRDYYFTVGYQVYNLTLYLINQNTYVPGIAEVRDYNGQLVEGAIIQLQRYYNDPNVPNIVEMTTTNSLGQALFTAEPITANYFWNVTYQGVSKYLSNTIEQLAIGSDAQIHRTFIFTRNESEAYNQYAGFTATMRPNSGSLNNRTAYNFTARLNSTLWNLTSCQFYLINTNTGATLATNSSFCNARGGYAVITYTTSSAGINITGVLNATTAYFTNQYFSYWAAPAVPAEQYTVKNVLQRISDFDGAGFNDFSRMFISIIIIMSVLVGIARTGSFVGRSEEYVWVAFLLILLLSYAGWMSVPIDTPSTLPEGFGEFLQQYAIAVMSGIVAFIGVLRRSGVFQ